MKSFELRFFFPVQKICYFLLYLNLLCSNTDFLMIYSPKFNGGVTEVKVPALMELIASESYFHIKLKWEQLQKFLHKY